LEDFHGLSHVGVILFELLYFLGELFHVDNYTLKYWPCQSGSKG
jgi:hypothetical protein